MKALLTVKVVTPGGEFVGEIQNNKVVREIKNETFRSFYYWNMEKLQTFAKAHGWQVSLHSEPLSESKQEI